MIGMLSIERNMYSTEHKDEEEMLEFVRVRCMKPLVVRYGC